MSKLTDLLRRVEQQNPDLARDLANEVKLLADRRSFGFNFECHIPETVELLRRSGQTALPRDPDALDPKLLVENKRGKDVEWKVRHEDVVKTPSIKPSEKSGG